jgi:hypothetical protein
VQAEADAATTSSATSLAIADLQTQVENLDEDKADAVSVDTALATKATIQS